MIQDPDTLAIEAAIGSPQFTAVFKERWECVPPKHHNYLLGLITNAGGGGGGGGLSTDGSAIPAVNPGDDTDLFIVEVSYNETTGDFTYERADTNVAVTPGTDFEPIGAAGGSTVPDRQVTSGEALSTAVDATLAIAGSGHTKITFYNTTDQRADINIGGRLSAVPSKGTFNTESMNLAAASSAVVTFAATPTEGELLANVERLT